MNSIPLGGERVGHLFVGPARRAAAGHPADATHAFDDRGVVPVRVLEPEQLGVLAPRRFVADLLLVAHFDRVVRVEPDDAVVLHVHGRHAVAGGGHEEGVVEADLQRAGLDFVVPLRPFVAAETEMPLADGAGRVARLLQERGDRRRAGRNRKGHVPRRNARAGLLPPRVRAGENGATRRRAGRSRRMGVGVAKPFLREPIKIRRAGMFRAVAGKIAVADVVCQDQHDVRLARLCVGSVGDCGGCSRRQTGRGDDERCKYA